MAATALLDRRSSADALRVPARRRALGLAAALLFEALLVLALLTLGRNPGSDRPEESALVTFDVGPPAPRPEAESERQREQPRDAPQQPRPAEVRQPPQPRPTPPTTKPATETPPPLVQLPANTMAAADLRSLPQAPPKSGPRMGPPAPPDSGDTPVVAGSGPNGEKLYAAAWYRKPYDSELRGYLSTANSPGWALIACRTVPDYKVDDCIALDEYPSGSQIARAALAAAWQFKVRPPQIGGRILVGEWVRIRIDYGIGGRG